MTSAAVLANTVYQSAWTTPDIQHLVPLRTQSSPSRHRLGAHAHDVAAGLGLGQPERRPLRAVGDAGQVLLLLLLAAGDHHRPGRQPGQQQHERRGVRVLGHLLDGDGQAEDAGARPAVLLGDAQPEQAGVAEQPRRGPAGTRPCRRSRGPAA